MRKLSSITAAGLVLSTVTFADVAIKIPAIAVTTPIADSANTKGVKALSGIGNYISGATGTSTLSLFATGTDAGAVKIDYNITNGSKAYSGATGLLIPIDKSWGIHDLSAATAITFEIRTDVAGTNANFLIGSPLNESFGNPDAALQTNVDGAGTPLAALKLTTAYTKVTINTGTDLVVSPWYTADAGAADEIALNTLWSGATAPGLNIGTAVKNFQFQPDWKWAGSGATISNGKGSMFVKNINIVGASLYSWNNGVGCAGTGFPLDHFGVKPTNQNAVGGYWFVYTDTSTAKPTDSATGASSIQSLTAVKAWGIWPANGGMGAIRTTLEKNVAATYHAYAGWADIGTNFATDELGGNVPVTFPGIKAISFDMYLGKAIADSLKWDSVQVPYITFKVGKKGIGDAQPFQIKIPAFKGDGSNLCVDMDSLTQPTWYTDKTSGGDVWTATDFTQLAWEIKIDDQSDATIHTSGPNTLALQNVKMWGLDSLTAANAVIGAIGVKGHAVRASGLVADYHNALVLSYSMAGTSAKVEVVRLDGSKVASFNAPAVAKNLNLPVSLVRGTYLVVVRGAKATTTAPLVVTR